MNITTPCHGEPPLVEYVWVGQAYMQEQVVDGYSCPAKRCYNQWDANGVATDYREPVQGDAKLSGNSADREPEPATATCPKCGVTVTDQTPSGFYSNHDERCGGPLEEPAPATDATATLSRVTDEQIDAATFALCDYDTDIADRGISKEHWEERRQDVLRVVGTLGFDREPEPTTEAKTKDEAMVVCRIISAVDNNEYRGAKQLLASDWLRERDAAKWDEGHAYGFYDQSENTKHSNPYRKTAPATEERSNRG